MRNIITIAGGASTYTPGIVKTILDNQKELNVSELRLYDIDLKKVQDMGSIIKQMIKQENLDHDISVIAGDNAEQIFTGTDFIFSQIRVGGLKMRELDEKIPLKHGLVGQETCGLGGFAYGLRSMKGFLEMVELIQKYAPQAWILNYTNPETIISESVRRKFPNAKIINACDMTQGIESTLAQSFGYDEKQWIPVYYGLNHFGWYDSIYDKSLGRDIMPEILERTKTEKIVLAEGDDSWKETYNMMNRIIEYYPQHIPNNYLEYYLFPDLKVEKANPNYTRANEVMDHRVKDIEALAQAAKANQAINIESSGHGQYIVDIAKSLILDLNMRFNLIVPNMGAIPNLRRDAVVEVPCYVSAKGIEPISLRNDIPDFHKGLMEAQVASEKLLVDAFFEQSYEKALQAFTLNQTVPNATVAKVVLDEMIEANGEYWPVLK